MINDELKMFLIYHSAFRVPHSRVASPSTDTAPPRRNAPQFRAPQPVPRPARSVPPLSALLSSAPRPARPESPTVHAPLLWPGKAARPWRLWPISSSPLFRGRFITQQETSHDSLLVLFLSSRHWTTVRV